MIVKFSEHKIYFIRTHARYVAKSVICFADRSTELPASAHSVPALGRHVQSPLRTCRALSRGATRAFGQRHTVGWGCMRGPRALRAAATSSSTVATPQGGQS
eukprot:scaffold1809_cov386-Prasinococcus_capsulatus_cf.AAC.36